MRINCYLKNGFGSVLAAWDLSLPKVSGELFWVCVFCDLFSRHFQVGLAAAASQSLRRQAWDECFISR